MVSRLGWTRGQLLIAFGLYCQLPFGRMHSRNPEIVKYADLIDRSPSALAMKLTNIASLDPAITSTGRSGLSGASAADNAMWREMHNDWDRFALEIDAAFQRLESTNPKDIQDSTGAGIDDDIDYSGKSKSAVTKVRVGQAFFRRAVLSAHGYRCCITGLAVPKLLLASHIVPWRADEKNRLNPRNGLSLSALHDRAFDEGIITLDEDYRVQVTKNIATEGDQFFASAIASFHGTRIELPQKFRPDQSFLQHHRDKYYKG